MHDMHCVCAQVKVLYWKVMYKIDPTLLDEFDPDGKDA